MPSYLSLLMDLDQDNISCRLVDIKDILRGCLVGPDISFSVDQLSLDFIPCWLVDVSTSFCSLLWSRYPSS